MIKTRKLLSVELERIPTHTKAEAAFLALRDAIQSGRLPPGQRVTLQRLADELGMSLTPVREALHQLAAQGLVEHRPNQHTVVTPYTRARAEEVYRLRLVLEPLAAQLAAEQMRDADLEALDATLAELDTLVEAGHNADLPALNARLHRRIYTVARSPFLLEFIDRLWNGLPFQAISLTGRQHRSADQHHAIIAALHARDGAAAAQATYDHIADGQQETLAHIDRLDAADPGDDDAPV